MRLGGKLSSKMPLASLRTDVGNPFRSGVSNKIVAAQRKSVDRDFARGGWHMPNGGYRRWKRTQPFGTRKIGRTLGGSSGGLNRAWQTGRVTKRRRSVSIAPRPRPDIVVHRGGSGTNASEGFTVIKAKKRGSNGRFAMGGFFGATYGVHLSEEKQRTGLMVPARPHATNNVHLRDDIELIIAESFL